MALPVILDCDPGHDDAIALILALASPELKVLAVTTSAGNQTPDKTLNNALRILTLLGRDDIPVAAGALVGGGAVFWLVGAAVGRGAPRAWTIRVPAGEAPQRERP